MQELLALQGCTGAPGGALFPSSTAVLFALSIIAESECQLDSEGMAAALTKANHPKQPVIIEACSRSLLPCGSPHSRQLQVSFY